MAASSGAAARAWSARPPSPWAPACCSISRGSFQLPEALALRDAQPARTTLAFRDVFLLRGGFSSDLDFLMATGFLVSSTTSSRLRTQPKADPIGVEPKRRPGETRHAGERSSVLCRCTTKPDGAEIERVRPLIVSRLDLGSC